MGQVAIVALGGAVGSVLRHLVGLGASRFFGPAFPMGTLAVNVAGSFAMGILVEVIARRFGGSVELRLLLATGLLGGFTTFSSYALEGVLLLERGEVGAALIYILGSVVLGLAGLLLGLMLMRLVL